jgi:PIN domain nuclease of toxin-antitoxin system
VLIWAADGRLPEDDRELLAERADEVLVSAATIWEIEIKRSLGRLQAPERLGPATLDAGYAPLQITFDHAIEAGRLPLHHRDPFDRMLVAQARVEGLTLATADSRMGRYDVPVRTIAAA